LYRLELRRRDHNARGEHQDGDEELDGDVEGQRRVREGGRVFVGGVHAAGKLLVNRSTYVVPITTRRSLQLGVSRSASSFRCRCAVWRGARRPWGIVHDDKEGGGNVRVCQEEEADGVERGA
jgi:hypothetical protein